MGPKAIDKHALTVLATVRSTFPIFDELENGKRAWNVYDYMLKLSSQIVGKLFIDADFGHFEAADSPVHTTVRTIFRLLGLNKKVTSWGDWYTWLFFGDPKRLRDTWHEVGERVGKYIAEAEVGEGDVPLQEAALKTAKLLLSGLEKCRKDLAKVQKRCGKDAYFLYTGVWAPAISKSILPPPKCVRKRPPIRQSYR